MKITLSILSLFIFSIVFSQMTDGSYSYLNSSVRMNITIDENGWNIPTVSVTDLQTGISKEGSGTWFKVNMNGVDEDYNGPDGWYQFTLDDCDYEFDAPLDVNTEVILHKYCDDTEHTYTLRLDLNAELTNNDISETEEENTSDFFLEDILKIESEVELIEKFGSENIRTEYSTEGPEGTEVVGYYVTLLYPETDNELFIYWEFEKQIVSSAYVNSFDSKWSTAEGVRIGTTLEALEELNSSLISFYGFGWDYGGLVSSYYTGLFEDKGLSIILCTENEEANMVLIGDQEFNSEMQETQNAGIYVCEFGLIKK